MLNSGVGFASTAYSVIGSNDLAKESRPIFSNPDFVSCFEELNCQENPSFLLLRWELWCLYRKICDDL